LPEDVSDCAILVVVARRKISTMGMENIPFRTFMDTHGQNLSAFCSSKSSSKLAGVCPALLPLKALEQASSVRTKSLVASQA
jgi:hypothetical protein